MLMELILYLMTGSKLAEKIDKWIAEMGFFKKEIPKSGLLYSVVIELAPQKYIEIKIPESQPDRLDVTAALKLHPKHLAQLQSMPNDKKKEFWYQVRRDVNLLPVSFILLPPGKPVNEVNGVGVAHIMYENGLTKTGFAYAIDAVNRAMFSIILNLEHFLGPTPPPDSKKHSQDFV